MYTKLSSFLKTCFVYGTERKQSQISSYSAFKSAAVNPEIRDKKTVSCTSSALKQYINTVPQTINRR